MADPDPEREKKNYWKVDPQLFRPGKPGTIREALKGFARTAGRTIGFTLLIVYPLILVILGAAYGGLVFWGTLGGSLALIGLLLRRLGYARRFAAADPRLARQLVSLFLAFLVIAGILFAILWLRLVALP